MFSVLAATLLYLVTKPRVQTMDVTDDQVKEHETQLADIQELLKASPDDAALLALKNDLEELISLSQLQPSASQEPEAGINFFNTATSAEQSTVESAAASLVSTEASSSATASAMHAAPEKEKKLKKVKDFEVPEHLKPVDSDSAAEKSRKMRAVKALKNKWRQQKKEVESNKKQKSWQSFQQKKKRTPTSIFATQEGSQSKVGVISAGSMTEFSERKRHKHS